MQLKIPAQFYITTFQGMREKNETEISILKKLKDSTFNNNNKKTIMLKD